MNNFREKYKDLSKVGWVSWLDLQTDLGETAKEFGAEIYIAMAPVSNFFSGAFSGPGAERGIPFSVSWIPGRIMMASVQTDKNDSLPLLIKILSPLEGDIPFCTYDDVESGLSTSEWSAVDRYQRFRYLREKEKSNKIRNLEIFPPGSMIPIPGTPEYA